MTGKTFGFILLVLFTLVLGAAKAATADVERDSESPVVVCN